MSVYKIAYESNECILGFEPRGKEWIQYNCALKIKDGGKKPGNWPKEKEKEAKYAAQFIW